MSAGLVGLLLLAAISMADKFDEENYGVKVQGGPSGRGQYFVDRRKEKPFRLLKGFSILL